MDFHKYNEQSKINFQINLSKQNQRTSKWCYPIISSHLAKDAKVFLNRPDNINSKVNEVCQ